MFSWLKSILPFYIVKKSKYNLLVHERNLYSKKLDGALRAYAKVAGGHNG